ncbi:uncharacterized protein LOC133829934 [Humulus lupulus]|uniref:uncharacterized protein LOC133829934 n=1 Tax=Humulus lupulus TaxID=3486 RepID=UPI002B40B262|nr:uncharacterized protein LOC133829934 [Humulus lupulus]
MASEDMFDMYSAPEAPTSRRHHGECSKAPPAKKTRTADPSIDGPSTNAAPPHSPLEQQNPPVPVGPTPSPPAPADQTQPAAPAPTGGDISSRALRSAKDRMAKILRPEHCREAMAGTDDGRRPDINPCTKRARKSNADCYCRPAPLGSYHREIQGVRATKTNATLLDEKNKLAEELRKKQTALDKAVESRDQYKESNLINYCESKKLEADLIASRQEADKLEARADELEKANASNLERYKGTTTKCFYEFLKHNQGAGFSYLPKRMRHTEIARCVARFAEEEKVKIPALPEISLATGVEGVDDEAADAVNQENPQDPPAL